MRCVCGGREYAAFAIHDDDSLHYLHFWCVDCGRQQQVFGDCDCKDLVNSDPEGLDNPPIGSEDGSFRERKRNRRDDRFQIGIFE